MQDCSGKYKPVKYFSFSFQYFLKLLLGQLCETWHLAAQICWKHYFWQDDTSQWSLRSHDASDSHLVQNGFGWSI